MDFEFRKSTLDDNYRAIFSMGHEALGRWIIEELGSDPKAIKLLLEQVEQLQGSSEEWQQKGKELTITINSEEILVQANSTFVESDLTDQQSIEEESHFGYYDEESVSLCGREDFIEVIDSWLAFVLRY
ncbi:YacL family protein [Vibrio sp. SS-MA-C1-2]|uniref:YacL family protein n=1 Tax=Vibrio sp. SS-MA-C1-2 TaxID=2908646 RepID=UPI001F294D47|nr:YacL family protein [Vibrio sp. SS-MA-C1-2]UJF19630.1 YacL family protein [Vibrio sp. SS-MA-C1-2]